MAGTFTKGENRIRPGIYYRSENADNTDLSEMRDGIVGVVLQAEWGPLNEVANVTSIAEAARIYGNGNACALITRIFQGGASLVKAVRVGGSGATKGSVTLKDKDNSPGVVITARYPGAREMTATVRTSIADDSVYEIVIMEGNAILTRATFLKKGTTPGANELTALVKAINSTADAVVTAALAPDAEGSEIATVSGAAFTPGTQGLAATETEYAAGLELLEADTFNVACVDSNDHAVHLQMKNFAERINEGGQLAMVVIGEPISSVYEARMEHVAAFNSRYVVCVVNGGYDAEGNLVDGYNIAAEIAGLVAAVPCSSSVTHKAIPGLVSVAGAMTNAQIENCLSNGALVISASSSGTPWVEQGINTLVHLSEDEDAGWKKIRRTKTRFELITRITQGCEGVIGTVNNDANGRATIKAIAGGIIGSMINEGKLISGTIVDDVLNSPTEDSAWFTIEVADLDSIEKIYLTYRFSFQ